MKTILSAGLKYFLFFCLLYGSLTAVSLIPRVGAACNYLYRQPAEALLQRIYPRAYLKLTSTAGEPDAIRVEYASKEKVQEQWRMANQPGGQKVPVQVRGKIYEVRFYNTFLSFYLFFVALMLLSPLPRNELIAGLLIGTLLYFLYSILKIALPLLFFFNQPDVAIYQSSDFWLRAVQNVNYYLTLGVNILVVLLLWVLLAFRKNNWEDLFERVGGR